MNVGGVIQGGIIQLVARRRVVGHGNPVCLAVA